MSLGLKFESRMILFYNYNGVGSMSFFYYLVPSCMKILYFSKVSSTTYASKSK
jgi:hypothetical protein